MRGVILLLLTTALTIACMSGALAQSDVHEEQVGENTSPSVPQHVITPRDGEAPSIEDGAAVEIITGGSSSDGAAKVSRMPILN